MEFTSDHKIAILNAQKKFLSAQVNAQQAQKQVETAQNEYAAVVNQVAGELKLDSTKHRVDLDALTITELEPAETNKVS